MSGNMSQLQTNALLQHQHQQPPPLPPPNPRPSLAANCTASSSITPTPISTGNNCNSSMTGGGGGGTTTSVGASSSDYKEKALREIRNSLQPFSLRNSGHEAPPPPPPIGGRPSSSSSTSSSHLHHNSHPHPTNNNMRASSPVTNGIVGGRLSSASTASSSSSQISSRQQQQYQQQHYHMVDVSQDRDVLFNHRHSQQVVMHNQPSHNHVYSHQKNATTNNNMTSSLSSSTATINSSDPPYPRHTSTSNSHHHHHNHQSLHATSGIENNHNHNHHSQSRLTGPNSLSMSQLPAAQLAQRLQALQINSNNGGALSSSGIGGSINSANSSFLTSQSSYTNSPASLNSFYSSISSPPPSYAASSSSGRQSPTPTISSSSDYSVPPMLQLKKILATASTTSSIASTGSGLSSIAASSIISSKNSHSDIHPSGTVMGNAVGNGTLNHSSLVSGSNLCNMSPSVTGSSASVSSTASATSHLKNMGNAQIQALRARQAKSQSPVIMQSVKSTQVQKPILQTAIAPVAPVATPLGSSGSANNSGNNSINNSITNINSSCGSHVVMPSPVSSAVVVTTHPSASSASRGASSNTSNNNADGKKNLVNGLLSGSSSAGAPSLSSLKSQVNVSQNQQNHAAQQPPPPPPPPIETIPSAGHLLKRRTQQQQTSSQSQHQPLTINGRVIGDAQVQGSTQTGIASPAPPAASRQLPPSLPPPPLPPSQPHTHRPPPTYDSAVQEQQRHQQNSHHSSSTTVPSHQMSSRSRTTTINGLCSSATTGNTFELESSPPPPPPPPYTATLATVTQDDSMSVSSGNSCRGDNLHPPPPPPPNPQNRPPLPTPIPDPPPYDVSVAVLNKQRAAMNSAVVTIGPGPTVTGVKSSINQIPARPPPPLPPNSDLVNTVESICASQVSASNGPTLPPKPNGDRTSTGLQFDTASISESDCSSVTSTSNMSLTSSNVTSNNSFPVNTPISVANGGVISSVPPPPPPVSTIPSSSSSGTPRRPAPLPPGMSDRESSSAGRQVVGEHHHPDVQHSHQKSGQPQVTTTTATTTKTTHQSPIPERKQLSKEKELERRETKVRNYSPAAFKFFMEQHVENVIKCQQEREMRRNQLEKEMIKFALSEADRAEMRKLLQRKESNYIRLRRAKMDKSMFQVIRVIGHGAFGEVSLVKKADANKLYAMKTLRKKDVLARKQYAHVKAERDILAEADNEWVVKLYYSFQDSENLYFIMDYIPGGDLMFLLQKLEIFDEPLAQFYIAELALALESVHKMGFIHRDIKPDNILIDKMGHIKLTDFGLCTGFRWTHNSKYYQRANGVTGDHSRQDSTDNLDDDYCLGEPIKSPSNGISAVLSSLTNGISKPLDRRRKQCLHQRCQAHSLVGTPNYIAPEILMRIPYTQSCDWWSVGVILYEMVIGAPPFYAQTPEETQQKIINWSMSLRFPLEPVISPAARDLILKLLSGPEERLGRSGADEIKKHPFFEGIDFVRLRQQKALYHPPISETDPTDTSNFDVLPPRPNESSDTTSGRAHIEDYVNGDRVDLNGRHPDHAFLEFTFRRFFDDAGQAYPIRTIVDVNSATSVVGTNNSSKQSTSQSDNNAQGSPVYV